MNVSKARNSCFQLSLTLRSARTTRMEEEATCWYCTPACITGRIQKNFYWVSVSPNLSPLMTSVVLLPSAREWERKERFKKRRQNFLTAHHARCSCLLCRGSRSAITAQKGEVFLLLVHLLNKQSGFQMITLALAFSSVCPYCLFLPKPFRPGAKDNPLPPPRITAYSHFPAICFWLLFIIHDTWMH